VIHELSDGFVISSRHVWMPGWYATREAAQFAFQFCDDELRKLNIAINREAKRAITTDDLKAHEPRVCFGCFKARNK